MLNATDGIIFVRSGPNPKLKLEGKQFGLTQNAKFTKIVLNQSLPQVKIQAQDSVYLYVLCFQNSQETLY
jgi:bifunctional pyridoxal-dependent enzyme with beta-cystathionase and maltose regulon repressor activities